MPESFWSPILPKVIKLTLSYAPLRSAELIVHLNDFTKALEIIIHQSYAHILLENFALFRANELAKLFHFCLFSAVEQKAFK